MEPPNQPDSRPAAETADSARLAIPAWIWGFWLLSFLGLALVGYSLAKFFAVEALARKPLEIKAERLQENRIRILGDRPFDLYGAFVLPQPSDAVPDPVQTCLEAEPGFYIFHPSHSDHFYRRNPYFGYFPENGLSYGSSKLAKPVMADGQKYTDYGIVLDMPEMGNDHQRAYCLIFIDEQRERWHQAIVTPPLPAKIWPLDSQLAEDELVITLATSEEGDIGPKITAHRYRNQDAPELEAELPSCQQAIFRATRRYFSTPPAPDSQEGEAAADVHRDDYESPVEILQLDIAVSPATTGRQKQVVEIRIPLDQLGQQHCHVFLIEYSDREKGDPFYGDYTKYTHVFYDRQHPDLNQLTQ